MKMRVQCLLSVALVVIAFTLAGCSDNSAYENEFTEYIGTITAPNLSGKTMTVNTVYFKQWHNSFSGEGKVVIEDIPSAVNDPLWVDTYILKFEGTMDPKTYVISGLVGVTGGQTCKSNCGGVSNSPYNHSSYWRVEINAGKLVNGQISAYPDFKTSTFVFEAVMQAKK